jgi:CRP-like cAMP-binding protein
MDVSFLKETALFYQMREEDIQSALSCIKATVSSYQKNDYLLFAGQSAPALGIVISGSVHIIKENILGDRMIIGIVSEHELFGETYACAGIQTMPVSIQALEDCKVLYVDISKLLNRCSNSCHFHQDMIENLVKIIAQKNMLLNAKMNYISHKTIRNRLEAYFLDQVELHQSSTFHIPFNRNELADFLCINRSAMSRELGNMKKEGLIVYRKNKFTYNMPL